jgi:hypothetical protein
MGTAQHLDVGGVVLGLIGGGASARSLAKSIVAKKAAEASVTNKIATRRWSYNPKVRVAAKNRNAGDAGGGPADDWALL